LLPPLSLSLSLSPWRFFHRAVFLPRTLALPPFPSLCDDISLPTMHSLPVPLCSATSPIVPHSSLRRNASPFLPSTATSLSPSRRGCNRVSLSRAYYTEATDALRAVLVTLAAKASRFRLVQRGQASMPSCLLRCDITLSLSFLSFLSMQLASISLLSPPLSLSLSFSLSLSLSFRSPNIFHAIAVVLVTRTHAIARFTMRYGSLRPSLYNLPSHSRIHRVSLFDTKAVHPIALARITVAHAIRSLVRYPPLFSSVLPPSIPSLSAYLPFLVSSLRLSVRGARDGNAEMEKHNYRRDSGADCSTTASAASLPHACMHVCTQARTRASASRDSNTDVEDVGAMRHARSVSRLAPRPATTACTLIARRTRS